MAPLQLLDVGCAYGGFMEAATIAGFNVSGFDVVPEAIESVRSNDMSAECCGQIRDFHGSHETLSLRSSRHPILLNTDRRHSGIFFVAIAPPRRHMCQKNPVQV